MSQIELNFEQPKNRPSRTFSFQEKLKEFEDKENFEIQRLKNKGLEKHSFLEDVEDWEEKLKKYQLTKLSQEFLKAGKFGGNYFSKATAVEIRDINDTFPPKQGEQPYAVYEQTDNPDPLTNQRNNKIWQVRIKTFGRNEFEDILDSKGNLLQSRNSNRLAS